MKRSAILFLLFASGLLAQAPASETEKNEEKQFPVLSSTGLRNQSAEKLFQAQARADYTLALELKDRRNYRAALRRFQDFRMLYPSHPQTHTVVAHIVDIYEKLSLPDRALNELRRYLAPANGTVSPGALPLLARQVDLEYRLGRWPEAASSCERLIAAFPASKEAEIARQRLAEIQAEPESPAETQSPPSSESDPSMKGTEIQESSLDRLGEGLDIEK